MEINQGKGAVKGMGGKTLCIIPARGGSKRIPRKNVRDFKGRPVIAWSIGAARESGIADTVMVSTDDKEIATVAKAYGAEVPFMRSSENADDRAGISEVLIEVVENYQKLGRSFDYVVCILATAPLIRASDLKKAYGMLKSCAGAGSICSVESFSYPPQRGLRLKDGRLEMLNPDHYTARSQDLEKIYHDCGQFFIFRTTALLRDRKLYTEYTLPFMLDETGAQDIDTDTDWKIAELKYELLYGKEGKNK